MISFHDMRHVSLCTLYANYAPVINLYRVWISSEGYSIKNHTGGKTPPPEKRGGGGAGSVNKKKEGVWGSAKKKEGPGFKKF